MTATLTTLVSFNGPDGATPYGTLFADVNGDLFGTTAFGGANGDGSVFELAKSGSTYTLVTLVSFDFTNGAAPTNGLIADANGDLFGTTTQGAPNGSTVFELVKSGSTYISTPL